MTKGLPIDIVDLLRRAGLNQYEAEAYATLLAQGPLTGYELGKRSAVPLSRSYDVLERLTTRGLALVQPGDPPRYLAQPQQQFLAELRSTMAATVDGLAAAFAALPAPDHGDEFWVLRGRAAILARAAALVAGAQDVVRLSLAHGAADELAGALAQAQARGCHVLRSPTLRLPDGIALLVGDQQALLGTLSPAAACQAVVSSNAALVAVLATALERSAPAMVQPTAAGSPRWSPPPLDWMAWEERKQRQVLSRGDRVA
ncbi:MAG TPA: helix-turn-helix domain-containing protein [Chloroflexota bacterium]